MTKDEIIKLIEDAKSNTEIYINDNVDNISQEYLRGYRNACSDVLRAIRQKEDLA